MILYNLREYAYTNKASMKEDNILIYAAYNTEYLVNNKDKGRCTNETPTVIYINSFVFLK